MHYAATVFPPDDAPSRYLLLLSCGDNKHEISTEAVKALYSGVNKTDGDSHDKQDVKQTVLPDFSDLVAYIHSKMQIRMSMPSGGKINIGSKTLPFNIATFSEVHFFNSNNHIIEKYIIFTYIYFL